MAERTLEHFFGNTTWTGSQVPRSVIVELAMALNIQESEPIRLSDGTLVSLPISNYKKVLAMIKSEINSWSS